MYKQTQRHKYRHIATNTDRKDHTQTADTFTHNPSLSKIKTECCYLADLF